MRDERITNPRGVRRVIVSVLGRTTALALSDLPNFVIPEWNHRYVRGTPLLRPRRQRPIGPFQEQRLTQDEILAAWAGRPVREKRQDRAGGR
ncbi:hypothetical protein [Chloroflexus sp.]|uniref:hypothetical protein n=1 Tax=Chloroflexus sp. TaxID=1904827 RepID=UPI002ACE9C9E|nr:hypothetical protein [Chloroflexus sp.]